MEKQEVGVYSSSEFRLVIEASSIPRRDIHLSLDDIDIQPGNCVSLCSSVPQTSRVACAPSSVSYLTCIRKYGCCYDNKNANYASCFYHPSSCLSIPVSNRQKCGSYDDDKGYCETLGCCYDESTPTGKLKCFKTPVTPTNFPLTVPPTSTPKPSPYDCSFENGWCGYKNIPFSKSNWTIHQGDSGIGINKDHTLQNEKGLMFLILVKVFNFSGLFL